MTNSPISYSKDLPLINFLGGYFNSAFTITIIVSILKILGISKGSWLLTTSLIWIPPAFIVGLISFASVCFYLVLLLSLLGNYCLQLSEKLKGLFN